jgi:hypothetical protein
MGSATITLACLLAAAGAGPGDLHYINERDFQIPVRLDKSRLADLKQVLLYSLSKDGTRWEQVGAILPDKDGFTFNAREDGTYQFKVGVIGKDGKRDPADIYAAPVGQRIVVDTLRPEVRIRSAERLGNEVVVRWDVTEEHPDWSSLRLEYRTSDSPGAAWTSVPLVSPESRQASIRITAAAPVAVRMRLQDLATNLSRWSEAAVSGGGSTTLAGGGEVPPPPPPPDMGPAPGAISPAVAPAPALPPADDGGWSPTPPGTGGQPVALVRQPDRTSASGLSGPGGNGPDLPAASGGKGSVVASSVPLPPPTGGTNPEAPVPPRPGRGGLPPLQVVKDRQLTLEYEVGKVGPSGVGGVDLYVTRDEGTTWQRAGSEEVTSMPVFADPRGQPAGTLRKLTVELPGDGVYGFYLVLKSGAGLSKRPPRNGDLPQMRIEVDTTPPEAQLFRPEPDPKRRDALLLRWGARDKNLGTHPVLLEWAEQKEGPWQAIGADLEHSGPYGQYVWVVPPSVPHHVYLRLTVRDTAGNVARAVTTDRILVDLIEPEVQSLRLSSNPR